MTKNKKEKYSKSKSKSKGDMKEVEAEIFFDK